MNARHRRDRGLLRRAEHGWRSSPAPYAVLRALVLQSEPPRRHSAAEPAAPGARTRPEL